MSTIQKVPQGPALRRAGATFPRGVAAMLLASAAMVCAAGAGCSRSPGQGNVDAAGTGGTPPADSGTPDHGGVGGAGGGPGSGGSGSAGTGGSVAPPPLGAVTFSVPSQAFQAPLQVTLATSLAGAEIRYTSDRTTPTATSPLYGGQPIDVLATTHLRARAFIGAAAAGPVAIALYIKRDFDVTSDVPLIVIDGYALGQPTDRDEYADIAFMVFEPTNGEAKLSQLPTYTSHAGWHIRGQSSASFPQKPYRVELRDAANEDLDYALLGMPADADWAFIPPYRDRSLIRNPLVFDLGREMGLAAPRIRFAEVYINFANRALGSGDYVGVYWITETIKNSKNRLPLKQLRAADTTLPAISGGYIMKFDWSVSEQPTLPCTGSPPSLSAAGAHCWTDLEVVDPEPLGVEQQAWITAYVQKMHDSLQTTPLGDYPSMLDVPSVVDAFIISELSRNLDAYTRSTYYHKDRDGKLKAGPLWDYNYAIDSGRATNRNPEGWQWMTEPQTTRMGGSNWIPRLVTDPAFMALVATRWKQLRQGVLATAAIDARIAAMTAPLKAAAERDNVKWPVRSAAQGTGPTDPTWTGQVEAVRTWLAKRTTWLDAQFP